MFSGEVFSEGEVRGVVDELRGSKRPGRELTRMRSAITAAGPKLRRIAWQATCRPSADLTPATTSRLLPIHFTLPVPARFGRSHTNILDSSRAAQSTLPNDTLHAIPLDAYSDADYTSALRAATQQSWPGSRRS